MGMSDQEKREQVIKGMEEILQRFLVHIGTAVDRDGYEFAMVDPDLIKDALALLKAQEPRVMTLDELDEKTDVYFEDLVYDTICPALSAGSYVDGTVGLMTLEDELFYMDEADYGVHWRCWTSRPTDEQREATPWTT